MRLKGQNFRLFTFDSQSEGYKVIGMSTNCTVNLQNNVEESSSKDGIPLLSDIPVIGSLFSSTVKQKHSVVRLFLIKATPIKSASSE